MVRRNRSQMQALEAEKVLADDASEASFIAQKSEGEVLVSEYDEKMKRRRKNFKQILDEQYASSLCKREIEQWKDLTPDDLAAKLTKQKLLENFPMTKGNVLVELWHHHDNNYLETVQTFYVLKASMMEKPFRMLLCGKCKKLIGKLR